MATFKRMSLLAVIVGAMVVVGCGGLDFGDDDDDNNGDNGVTRDQALVGTWQLDSATINGQTATIAEGMDAANPAVDGATFTFAADGHWTTTEYVGQDLDCTHAGTWTSSGGAFTVTFFADQDQDTMLYQITGNQMTCTFVESGNTIVLTLTRQ